MAEEGNVGRAAARLHMTQPPLTRRIHRLEVEVGADLFVRGSHGVDLTPSGRSLLEDARRLLSDSDRAAERARAAEAGRAGRLLVGFTGTAVLGFMPPVLASFTSAHPGVSLRLRRLTKEHLLRGLEEGSVHVGFGRFPHELPGTVVRTVGSAPLFVAAPERLKLPELPALAELADQPIVTFPRIWPSFADEVVALCTRAGFSPKVVASAEDALEALAFVATGAAIAVVPEPVTNIRLPGVQYRRIADGPALALSCVARIDDAVPIIATFMAHLEQTVD